MGELRSALVVWRRLVGARIRADWQYRTSFFLFLVSQTFVATLDLAVIAVLFTRVDTLAGWTGMEVALLFGLGGVSFGLADLLVSQVETCARHIKAGTFDLFLLRPLGTLLHISASEFALRRVGRVVQPAIVLVVALVAGPIRWRPEAMLLVPVAIVSGAVVFGSIWVISSSISFWTVESQEVANAFTYGGGQVVQYPIDVFADWLRRLVTFAVPLAFVAYLPAARLLGRQEPLGLPNAIGWAAPVVALAAAIGARSVWGLALRHHQSTGS